MADDIADTQKIILEDRPGRASVCISHSERLKNFERRLLHVEETQESQGADIKALLREVASISATLKVQTALIFVVAAALLAKAIG
jgi:hypothetical protein